MTFAASAVDLGPVLLGLVVVLVVAKAGGEVAERLRQPAVVGEILAGVVLGNVALLGLPSLPQSETLHVLAEIGILLLLFEIGVEATVPEMLRTGLSALLVGVVGVVAPLLLGTVVARAFFPDASTYTHLFVGAILCATSVGLTARVLRDLGLTKTGEARLILGAAVIDDVLGLVLLAVLSGLIGAADAGVALGPGRIAWIAGSALLFLGVSIPVGRWLAPRAFRLATRLQSRGVLLTGSLVFCFFLSWLSTLVGLAPIVGAFTAGLVLEDVHFEELATKERRSLEDLLHPITSLLLPVFFVLIGAQVDVRRFADPSVLAFAGVLTVAAVVGKLACAAVVLGPADRWAVAIGMVPRGEVGFVFAGIGTTLLLGGEPVVSPGVFASAVLVVILTTVATPPALVARLARVRRRREPPREDAETR